MSCMFFLFISKVLEQHETVVQTEGKYVCWTDTLHGNKTRSKTALPVSDKKEYLLV